MSARPRTAKGPRGGRKRRPLAAWLAAVALGFAAAAALAGVYLLTPKRGRGAAVRVTIPAGASAAQVTTLLWRAGVVERPWAFRPLLVLSGAYGRVRPGMVPLRDDLAPRAVLRALARGGGLVRVTVPEGFTRFEIARRLDAMGVCDDAAFLAATEAPDAVRAAGATAGEGVAPTLEGYLFPDTYDLPLGGPCEAVVERMTGVFQRRMEALRGRHPEGFARAAAMAGDDGDPVRLLVTLASLVEAETGHPDDRPHVAGVFWNRLTRPDFRPRLLQSDPAVTYGCLAGPRAGAPVACAPADGGAPPITAAMLDDPRNPWNTYRHEGLPPTPVCNPGGAALEAALAPLASDDLYFVARGDGRSAFAATLDAHRRNVRELLRPRPRPPGGAP